MDRVLTSRLFLTSTLNRTLASDNEFHHQQQKINTHLSSLRPQQKNQYCYTVFVSFSYLGTIYRQLQSLYQRCQRHEQTRHLFLTHRTRNKQENQVFRFWDNILHSHFFYFGCQMLEWVLSCHFNPPLSSQFSMSLEPDHSSRFKPLNFKLLRPAHSI